MCMYLIVFNRFKNNNKDNKKLNHNKFYYIILIKINNEKLKRRSKQLKESTRDC